MKATRVNTFSWWAAHRFSFNIAIVVGYAIAWLIMAAAALQSAADWDRNAFFTVTGLVNSILFLALVALSSNLLYFVGSTTERVLPDSIGLRRTLFTILWVIPSALMIAFAVWWAADVLLNPWLLDGGLLE